MIELYVSTDVETDGPIPGPHSMLSLGSVAFLEDGTEVGSFAANLVELPGATMHSDTLAWWDKNREAWQAARERPEDPAQVMRTYVAWLKALPGKPVFVGYPAGFDFLWTQWYLIRFTGERPFGISALDIKTYAMAVLRQKSRRRISEATVAECATYRPEIGFRETVKKAMPKAWFAGTGCHTHRAVDDAREQGRLFCNILREERSWTDG